MAYSVIYSPLHKRTHYFMRMAALFNDYIYMWLQSPQITRVIST